MRKPRRSFRLHPLAVALAAAGFCSIDGVVAAPQGGTVIAGEVRIGSDGPTTTIVQTSDRAIINWREFSTAADESVRFIQPSAQSATLNRVTGEQASVLLGLLQANGRILLINPNGIVIGPGARLDVGSLIATTAQLDDADFLAGRLEFTPSDSRGTGIVNEGAITAAEGGLVALVAPHVRNDGVIVARLGRVLIGAADRFAIDLYGDGLINLALDPSHSEALRGADGRPVDALLTMNGEIRTDGGETVLITAAHARTVLDSTINLGGTIRADHAEARDGRIILAGGDGTARVDGTLAAQGAHGGRIEVTGDRILLDSGARLDASGESGGGIVRVGGDWQGGGTLQRASSSQVASGAAIDVSATHAGNAGSAVVWSDGETRYAGSIAARGGASGGDGGQVEVSGAQSLVFAGEVDAGASRGASGSLLLDPTIMNIGAAEALLINRVLRTGTSTTIAADLDINVNSLIDGRGRASGGGITFNAGRDINLNDYVVTQNGVLNFNAATGTLNIAAGKAAFSGSAAINVTTGGNLAVGNLFTTGALTARSIGGSISLAAGIDSLTGPVLLRAAQNLTVDQPIVNLANGSRLDLVADTGSVTVAAQIDGRDGGGAPSGALSITAGGNVQINEHVVTENAAISVSAGGTYAQAAGKGLFAGSGAIDLTSGGTLALGGAYTSGTLTARSTGGALNLVQGIDNTSGPVSLRAAQSLTVGQPIINIQNGSALTLTSDAGAVIVNGQIDGRAANGIPSGTVTVNAATGITLNQSIVTEDAALSLTTTSGTVTAAAGQGLFAGNGPISVTTGGALTTGLYSTTGSLSLRSTGGALTVGTALDETIGGITLRGATGVNLNQGIANIRNGSSLTVIADTGNIAVNARIDALDDANPASIAPVAGGTVTLSAGNNVAINETITTFNGAVNVTATNGTVTFSNAGTNGSGNKKIMAGTAPISITTGGNFSTGTAPPGGLSFDAGPTPPADVDQFFADSLKPWVTLATTGTLSITSTGGNVNIDAPIPQTTGTVNLSAGNDVIVNEKLVNAAAAPISVTAGTACTVATCSPTTQGRIVVNEAISEGTNLTYDSGAFTLAKGDSPEIDSRVGNLTMTAFGDIDINEAVASAGTMTLTSTNGRLLGTVGNSRNTGSKRPANMILSGGAGIGELASPFNAGNAGAITATSANGPVYLNVSGPGALNVSTDSSTLGDIVMYHDHGGLGPNSTFTAGRDLDLRNSYLAGSLSGSAGRDVLFQEMSAGLINITGAGQDVKFDATGMGTGASIWSGPLTVTGVARDILFLNESGVSIMDADGTPTTGIQPTLTLSAGGDVELRRLQTYGAVNISAGDDIRLLNDIGPTITSPTFFTEDKGVASLTLTTGTALGNRIDMQGARAVGAVNITTHTLAAAKQITGSVVNISATSSTIGATPIGTMAEMTGPNIVAPAIPPGPAVNPPTPPGALTALAPAAPGGAGVSPDATPGGIAVAGGTAPAASGGELAEIDPSEVAGATELAEIIPPGGESGTGEGGDTTVVWSFDAPPPAPDFGRGGPFSGRDAEGRGSECSDSDRAAGQCA